MTIDNSLRRQGIKLLEDEQNELDGAFDPQSTERAPEALVFDKIEQTEDGTWSKTQYTPKETFYDENVVSDKERETKDKAEVLRRLCGEVDNKIIRLNNEINEKKQLIVDLSTEALNRNCSPGIAQSVGMPGVTTSLYVSSAINNDVEFVKIYEKMAGPGYDPGAENPFDPDSLVILNSSYSGYGYKNVRDNKEMFVGSGTTTGINTDGSGAGIGTGRFDISKTAADHAAGTPLVDYSYPGAGVAPATDTSLTGAAAQNRCVAIASSITTIYEEIIAIRQNRDSLRNALNTVKENKSEKELTHWGMQNTRNEVNIRKNKNKTAITAITNLDVQEDGIPLPEGLQLDLDASNNSSYYGSGTLWYDLAEGEDASGTAIPGNDADLGGGAESHFIDDPISDERNRFDFDGVDDHVNINVPNISATAPIVTVEVLAKLTIDLDVADSEGYMIFGWNQYSIWTGPLTGDGTPFGLGSNTGNGDLYGLSPTRVNNLGLNNNFVHYVFEMRSDVSYTNNKIYINGNLQSSLEAVRSDDENTSNRHFNSGLGRIAGWRLNNKYRMPMEISLFRAYNKALTQEEVTERFNAVGGRF